MHYRFPAGLILKPERYRTQPLIPKPGLSSTDIQQARTLYPPLRPSLPELLRPLRSATPTLEPGEQANYLIRPNETRDYVIQTFGPADSVLVLFEQIDGVQPLCRWRRRQWSRTQRLLAAAPSSRTHLCASASPVLRAPSHRTRGDALMTHPPTAATSMADKPKNLSPTALSPPPSQLPAPVAIPRTPFDSRPCQPLQPTAKQFPAINPTRYSSFRTSAPRCRSRRPATTPQPPSPTAYPSYSLSRYLLYVPLLVPRPSVAHISIPL